MATLVYWLWGWICGPFSEDPCLFGVPYIKSERRTNDQTQAECPKWERRGTLLLSATAAVALFLCLALVGNASCLRHRAASGAPPTPTSTSPSKGGDIPADARLPSKENGRMIPHGRSLSWSLPDGGCRVSHARLSDAPVARPQTWQASFPGSGARMTWKLVEALTGTRMNDDFDSIGIGYDRVAAVKTHYPVKRTRGKFAAIDESFGRDSRAILILRNPLNAIPSYFNLRYEQMHHLPSHSTRGPNEDWIKYRDGPGTRLSYQLGNYERFVNYWMARYAERMHDLLIVAYEDLTDDTAGPLEAVRMAAFLAKSEGIDPIHPDSIPCVWETVVRYKHALYGHLNPSSLRKGPSIRPYSQQNLSEILAVLRKLVDRFGDNNEFERIISSYVDLVLNTFASEG